MDFAEFTKRQKCNDDSFYGNNSTPLSPRANLPLMRNTSYTVLSEGKPIDQEGQKDLLGDGVFNVDEMILERNSDYNNGKLNFLGLALVFGAVGMASFISASPVEGSAGIS